MQAGDSRQQLLLAGLRHDHRRLQRGVNSRFRNSHHHQRHGGMGLTDPGHRRRDVHLPVQLSGNVRLQVLFPPRRDEGDDHRQPCGRRHAPDRGGDLPGLEHDLRRHGMERGLQHGWRRLLRHRLRLGVGSHPRSGEQQGSGNYWNGSSFGSTSEVFFDATGTTSWSYAFPATNFPTDDAYTIRAKATDDENNVSTVASTTFTVDPTAPPTPTITSTPPDPSTSTSASFSFDDAEAGVTFECRLDAGAFAVCTSPQSYSGVTAGTHTFEVRAVDTVGNRSGATSHTWTMQACSQVSVNSNFFSPTSVTIAAGCTVTWTRMSGTHTSTSTTGVWSSQTLDTAGETFTFQFNTAGTYSYRCNFHSSTMTGTIRVN
jgi:plastocyanin